jgi:hypothetical protein
MIREAKKHINIAEVQIDASFFLSMSQTIVEEQLRKVHWRGISTSEMRRPLGQAARLGFARCLSLVFDQLKVARMGKKGYFFSSLFTSGYAALRLALAPFTKTTRLTL